MDFGIQFWPVLVATIAYFALGAVWYSDVLFAKPWMAGQGITRDTMDRSGLATSMVTTFLLELLALYVLAVVLVSMGIDGWANGAVAGFVIGVGIGAVPMAVTAAYETRPWSLLWINAGYHVVAMTLAGLIIGIW